MRFCDKCKRKCIKTPYGSCVIICKEDIVICMDCNIYRLKFDSFKYRYNILKFIRNREISQEKLKIIL